jgi:hypothetical protein
VVAPMPTCATIAPTATASIPPARAKLTGKGRSGGAYLIVVAKAKSVSNPNASLKTALASTRAEGVVALRTDAPDYARMQLTSSNASGNPLDASESRSETKGPCPCAGDGCGDSSPTGPAQFLYAPGLGPTDTRPVPNRP